MRSPKSSKCSPSWHLNAIVESFEMHFQCNLWICIVILEDFWNIVNTIPEELWGQSFENPRCNLGSVLSETSDGLRVQLQGFVVQSQENSVCKCSHRNLMKTKPKILWVHTYKEPQCTFGSGSIQGEIRVYILKGFQLNLSKI